MSGIPPADPLVSTTPRVRDAARRLRWFSESFARQIDILSRDSGVRYDTDQRRLARAFVQWLRAFEAQRDAAAVDRREFTHFAAGLMLRELVRENPLTARPPDGGDPANPAYYWPEGYAYVAYCLNVCDAVLRQEFDARIDLAPELGEIDYWWTFRENARADPNLAIAFLDKFSGGAPDWSAPELFFARRGVRATLDHPHAPSLGPGQAPG